MPVSIRRHGSMATATANPGQAVEWSGDSLLVTLARQTMFENAWERGVFLSDELFLAQRVAQKLGDCEIVDADLIISSIREGWIQLLRDHLMPDPGAPDEHLNRLTTGKDLSCTIEARGDKLSLKHARVQRWPVSGVVNVGDPIFLGFTSRKGITWHARVRWENIECIRFSYFNPIPNPLANEARDKIRNRLVALA